MRRQLIKDQSNLITALYCRLSREDDSKDESSSISNQKEMLQRFAECQNLSNIKFYIDDGYSGANFNRPGFRALEADVKNGKIGTVIVKDLSRLGRNYLGTGHYIEVFFTDANVRFISIDDNKDTANAQDNDFTPFKNIINEWYVNDISKKTRSSLKNKGMSGKPLSVRPPYGYKLDPENSNHWIIDEEAAAIVREIYSLSLAGKGPSQIAKILTEEKYLTPMAYSVSKGFKQRGTRKTNDYAWNTETVIIILKRYAYAGHTVNFTTGYKSLRNHKKIYKDESEWVIFKNTHDAIVDEQTWLTVQQGRENTRKPIRQGNAGMFSGLVFCADCGQRLYQARATNWPHEQEYYTCSTYRKGQGCSTHYIRTISLEQLSLDAIRSVIKLVIDDESSFIKMAANYSKLKSEKISKAQIEEYSKLVNRQKELDIILTNLYEEKVLNKLPAERYEKMSTKFEEELQLVTSRLTTLKDLVNTVDEQTANSKAFTNIVRKFIDATELTPLLLHEFIKKIIVHQDKKVDGHHTQKVDIVFNCIGEFNPTPKNIA